MVNNISFGGGSYNLRKYSSDLENVAKYTLGTTLVAQEENPFDGMLPMIGLTGLMGIPTLRKWFKDAKNEGGPAKKWADEINEIIHPKVKSPLSNDGWKNLDTYKTAWNNYSADMTEKAIPDEAKLAKLNPVDKENAEKAYAKVKEYTEAAKNAKTTKEKVTALKNANKSLAEANLAVNGKYEAKGIGKVGEFLSKWTGFSKLSSMAKGFATKSPTFANILKFGKGNGIFAAITGGIALFTQVIPAFGLGADKGISQLGKSTVKTAATVGGWAAGMAAGSAIGTLICPAAGTLVGGAIGAIIGIVGGSLGSWAADKVAEEIVGKDELEIAQEEKANEMTQEAIKDPQVAQKLLMAAQEKLKSEDPNSEEAKIIRKSIGELAQIIQAQAPPPQSQQGGNQNGLYIPPITGADMMANSQKYSSNPFAQQQG